MLGLGAWVGPGVVEGGSGTESVIDQPPETAVSAAYRYLSYSIDRNDQSPAQGVICDDYTPNLMPEDLREIREELQGDGSRPQFNPELLSTEENESLTAVNYKVDLVLDGRTESFDIQLSVFEDNGEYCVAAVDDTSNDDENGNGDTDTDSRSTAIDFVSAIFSRNDIKGAESLLCNEYSGPSPEEVRNFHEEFASDPDSPGDRDFGDPDSEAVDELLEVTIGTTDGEITLSFAFTVGEDCIAEIADIPELEEMPSGDDPEDGDNGNDD